MKKALIGYQLYSAREEAEKDLLGVLKQLKALGYDGVEFAGFYGNTADQIAEMLKEAAAFPRCLFCYEGGGTRSLKEICAAHPDTREIAVVVGSEGGFSEREAEAAAAAGLAMTGLGKRILRCETAPLYALSALSFFYEL